MSKKGKGFHIIFIFLVLLPFLLVACNNVPSTLTLIDVLTLKPSHGNIQITMMTSEGVYLEEFEKAVEEKYSGLDLVLVGSYTAAHDEEIAKRLERGDLTDLVMFSSPNAGIAHQSTRLVDLSSLALTSKYAVSALDSVRKDGHVYMVPLPSRLRCLIYNKTLFEEGGYTVPTNFDQFVTLAKKITTESSGELGTKTSGFRYSMSDSNALLRAFLSFGYQVAMKDNEAESATWLKAFNAADESASFDKMHPAFDNFFKLVEEGVIEISGEKNNFEYYPDNRAEDLLSRGIAITEGSPHLLNEIESHRVEFASNTDEFGLMPIFSGGEDSDWLGYGVPAYYGMSATLKNDMAKYKMAQNVMDFLSSVEGQSVLISSGNGQFSNLVNGISTQNDSLLNIESAIAHGQFSSFDFLNKNASDALSYALKETFDGKTILLSEIVDSLGKKQSKEDAFAKIVRIVDSANRSSTVVKGEYLGSVSEDFTFQATGSFIADAIKKATGAEIALYPDIGKDGDCNHLGLATKFYLGNIYTADLMRILPVSPGSQYGKIVKLLMRGEQIIEALEYALSKEGGDDGFYYFSGLKVRYRPTAKQGERVVSVTKADGSALDKNTPYIVAAPNRTVAQAFLSGGVEDTGLTIIEVVKNAVISARTLSPLKDGRFTILA